MRKIILVLFSMLAGLSAIFAQGVRIAGTSGTPDASAMLQVDATDKGVLIPRMTEAQRTGISSPANGLMVYQYDGDAGFYIYYENPQSSANSGWSKLPLGQNGFYLNFPSSTNSDITLGSSGYGIRSNGGQLEYKNEGDANWTAFPTPPPWGALTVWWYKPLGAVYIRPDNNSNIRVYDDNQQYGFYFDGGTNQYGLFVRSTSNTYYPTGAIVGWTDVAGQQTYGYLGYRGHIGFGTSNPQNVWGAAVWGEVPDTNSLAGFFRTYSNANSAALVSYSDRWIPAYFYCDDNSTSNSPTSLYSQLDVNVSNSISAYEATIKALSSYNPSSGNSSYTTGGYFAGVGYQDAIGVRAIGSSSNTGYGVWASGNSGGYAKSGYFSGIGGVFAGDLTGSISSGDVFGLNVLGNRYGLYVNNLQINEAPIVEMIPSKNKKIATYVTVSQTNDIILKGTATMNSKSMKINFDKDIAAVIDSKSPIIITITPVGSAADLYVDSYSTNGFTVKLSQDNPNANVKFNWIAIAQKAQTTQIPQEVFDTDYSDKMQKVAFGELKMTWDGNKISYEETGKTLRFSEDEYKKMKQPVKIK